MRIREPANFPIVLKGISELTPKIITAGGIGLKRGLEYTRTIVQREFLSGPRPGRLDVVSTRLRQSIAIDVQTSPRGVVGRIGSNVKYAAFHEFGFRGLQEVKAHLRKGANVKAHSRSINYEGKPFIRPALIKGRPLILKEVQRELAGVKP